MARDQLNEQGKYEIVGGYFSPVSDQYTKEGLAPSEHRVKMCKLAVDSTSEWLMVDNWESLQPGYQRTLVVLDHFNEEININLGGIETLNGNHTLIKLTILY
jgi:nicotinamide mononucleotide adenylyltransferase